MAIRTSVLLFMVAATSVAAAAPKFQVSKVSISGEGRHDYINAEPGTGRVFVSRGTHVMVIDGPSGKVIGDIPDTPRVHGIALVKKYNRGFTTNEGDSTVSMFQLKTLVVEKKIPVPVEGVDGIMYDAASDRVVLTHHSKPGTASFIDPKAGEVVATVELEDETPEGAVGDGIGRIFVNNLSKNTMQTIDLKSMKTVASWPLAPCRGPTGIAYDRKTRRVFSGCSNASVVVDADSGRVVATIANGNGVDGIAWDPTEKLLYIPAGRDGTVTIVHQDSADAYTTLTTLQTAVNARTITIDPVSHKAYQLALEYGPAPADVPAPPPGGLPARGPVIGAQFVTISH